MEPRNITTAPTGDWYDFRLIFRAKDDKDATSVMREMMETLPSHVLCDTMSLTTMAPREEER